jgi:DNA-binding NtrC family response regulator
MSSRRKPILVITDDKRPYHAFTLQGEEIEFASVKEAFDPAHGIPADLVLLYVHDRTRQDMALLEKIKTAAPGIPVIVVADSGSENHVARAFRLGARDYVRKPFQRDELQRAVKRCLRLKRIMLLITRPAGRTHTACVVRTAFEPFAF